MKISLGMAHHTDFGGAYFTIQHIRQTNRRLKDMEFVVVDNSVGSPIPKAKQHASDLKNFIGNCQRGTAVAKYIELPESEAYGTTQPRNRVFAEATGDIVVCMDCHVLPEPFALDKLLAWYEETPDCLDLISGPILNDDMSVMADSFANVWRDQMWGIWDLSPRCLADGPTEELPIIERQEKMKPNGMLCPYEIGAMGLGLFGCLKKAWLGFNEHFRGFGGEEWYIHEKFRNAGRKCLCLPWLRWNHRFGRPDGISYPISMEHKVRNYILGHLELGRPLDPIYKHFVEAGHLNKAAWDWLIADPVNHVPQPSIPTTLRSQMEQQPRQNFAIEGAVIDASRPQPPANSNLDEVFEWCRTIPRDLNEHLATLREWAKKVQHVTEFSERRESTVGLLAARPKTLISYNTENDLLISAEGALHKLAATEEQIEKFQTIVGDSLVIPEIEETDLLFIDTKHNESRLLAELERHGPKVRRAIALHDTVLYCERGDGGGAGLCEGMRKWIDAHPEWFVAFHATNQYGLTVLSKNDEDRPKEAVHAWAPGFGPGIELKKILSTMDINPDPSCDCIAKAKQMDIWGPDKCDANFDTIVGWMREGEVRWGWKDKWAAGVKLLLKDPILAFTLDPTDPFPGLIKAAIKRARKDEKKRAKKDAA